MSDEEEVAIGNQLAKMYVSQREDKKDPQTVEIENYVSKLGAQLATHAHRKLPYQFHYIPDDGFLNAFALPGGHVFVGSGLMSLMDSEDELAAVIGHEIEHIDHYHCADRAQRERAMRKLPFFGLPVELFEAGYSKDQELEADREGTRLAVNSGYSASGAVRMFEIFQRLYDEYQGRAKTPEDELANVTRETLEGYFRSHPLPSERIAQIQKMIASENWPLHAEKDLAVAYIFWTNRAAAALENRRFTDAQQLATRSLHMNPKQPKALLTLAKAQFAQADFAGAAASYESLVGIDVFHPDTAYGYAQALAAADRSTAAAKFRHWVDTRGGPPERDLQVPMAGLSLLSGDSTPAKSVAATARSNEGQDWAPDWLGQLGWWYYLAGDHLTALSLTSEAIQLRPSNPELTTQQAWTQIEDRKLSDALDSLQSTYDSQVRHDRQVAKAVVYWLSHQNDQAMIDFEAATSGTSEWNNPAWVRALYSPLVADSVKDMQGELARRRKMASARP